MAETLGDAILYLRTDDKGLTGGIGDARRKTEALGNTFDETGARATRMSRASRIGMQQLGFQFQDFAVMVSGGQGALRALSMQLPQAIDALQLMSLGAERGGGMLGRMASIVGGPIGVALGVAVPLVAMLAQHLFDVADAAELATKGSDGLSDAQTVLGQMFDLATGKIKRQNDVLLLNARLTALNLRAQAAAEGASSKKVLGFDQNTSQGLKFWHSVLGFYGQSLLLQSNAYTKPGSAPASSGMPLLNQQQQSVVDLVTQLRAGRITRDAALQRAAELDYSGLSISKTQLEQAIIDSASSELKLKTADLIDQALDSGKLPSDFLNPSKGHRPRKTSTKTPSDMFLDTSFWVQQQIAANDSKTGALASGNAGQFSAQPRSLQWVELMRQMDEEGQKRNESQRQFNKLVADGVQIGEQFVDTLFDPRNWQDFGDLGKQVLRELENEMIRLAILNPIKNMLFGESNSTLSSLAGVVGSIFSGLAGGGAITSGAAFSNPSSLLGFAGGTDSAPGGLSLVGEKGPELLNMPRGSQVIPAGETRRLLGGSGRAVAVSMPISIDATGADAAALSRVAAKLDALERALPGVIVRTVGDANSRGYFG